jgi:hypothetical protein
MEILLSVGVKVMAPVMGRPPEWPLLISCSSNESEQKLENSAGSVSAVREKAMKPSRYREHAHNVQGQTRDDSHCTDARPNDEQASDMHEEELDADGAV